MDGWTFLTLLRVNVLISFDAIRYVRSSKSTPLINIIDIELSGEKFSRRSKARATQLGAEI